MVAIHAVVRCSALRVGFDTSEAYAQPSPTPYWRVRAEVGATDIAGAPWTACELMLVEGGMVAPTSEPRLPEGGETHHRLGISIG